MGLFRDDEPDDDDQTIGVPHKAASDDIVRKLGGRAPAPPRPVMPPSDDPGDGSLQTILPPAPARPRSPAPNPSPPPQRPEPAPAPRARPQPQPPPAPSHGQRAGIDPNPWDDQPASEDPGGFLTALGPPSTTGAHSLPPSSGPAEGPWTIGVGTEPAPMPPAAPPPQPRYEPPRPAPVRTDPVPPPRAVSPPAAPRVPPRAPASRSGSETIIAGQRFGRGNLARKRLYLQIQDAEGQWHDLHQLRPGEGVFGRELLLDWLPNVDFLAPEHLLFISSDEGLFVEGFSTLNGFYRKLSPGRPEELADGMRFQVGSHVIEFRLPPPTEDPQPQESHVGEVFSSRPLTPLAFLDFIGPDNQPSLSVPLTKQDYTVLGREGGSACDIGLACDMKTSGRHARIVRDEGRFFLEDLKSTNGTFLQVNGQLPLGPGTEHDPGSGDVLAVGEVLLRVVER